MKNAQVSFEFVVLFAFLLLVFVLLAQIFPMSIEGTTSTKGIAENIAKDIKTKVITASLSDADYTGEVVMPTKINNVKIALNITKDPDNVLSIINLDDNETIARVFLPNINDVTDTASPGPVVKVKVSKTMTLNQIIIEMIR